MQNVWQIWQETTKRLQKVYDQKESENIAYLLLEDQFQISKTQIMLREQLEVDQNRLEESIGHLLENKPVQYVTGIADFYNRRFHAGQGVLIPRPETEELVALILKERKSAKPRILDIGVGSGCIAITLALEMESDVFGTDVSEAALELANANAIQLGARVTFLKHDILAEPLTLDSLDILVSNPPYIPNSDKPLMHNNVLEYEPETALFVSDDDPLIFYQRIAEEGRAALREGGRLYFEIHENYGPQVKGLVESMGYTEVEVHLDMQGKDRILSATNSAST